MSLQAIEKDLFFESCAMAIGTYHVTSITGKIDPYMHFVSLGLQPPEEAPHTVIISGSFNNGLLSGFGQTLKGYIDGNLFAPAERHQIDKFHAAIFPGSPGFNSTLLKGE
jgi:hypothetical protein